ncbi:YfiT family bacillithiol transferase [Rufibacter roseus]|uniref:YfiT family bacillithiol transferase n=1 Tax=Rufibacter roseus TaxID=1567108 RepID=A0ABW2DJH3_9BACT|nr:bacillithiol transferase BstA [Rufibacter roseus]
METPTLTIEQLRFPVGRYELPTVFQSKIVKEAMAAIEDLPAQLVDAVSGLSEEQLDTPYRPSGWTLRQVVHHLPDSHMNSYIRFRLALTEERPIIKPYDETGWAQLPDACTADPAVSLQLLAPLHERWTMLLQSLTFEQWHRTFVHPEGGEIYLFQAAGLYAWHGRHHLAHIMSLKERMGW